MAQFHRCFVIGFGIVLVLIIARPATAQLVGGAIQGVVKDAQGAALPGASIVIRNLATGVTWEQTADRSGRYQVLALPPAEYEVQVSMTGFRSVAHRGIRLTVGQTAVIDTSLDLGAISETIEENQEGSSRPPSANGPAPLITAVIRAQPPISAHVVPALNDSSRDRSRGAAARSASRATRPAPARPAA